MKIYGNCLINGWYCKHYKAAERLAGWTGFSGKITWNYCKYYKEYQRNIKKCTLNNKEKSNGNNINK